MDETLIPFAKEQKVGIFDASALRMGIVTERGAPDWHPAPVQVRESGRNIIGQCKAHGVDGSEVALKFCFDHPGVASTLVGMSTNRHVDANPKALEIRINAPLLAQIHELVTQIYS